MHDFRISFLEKTDPIDKYYDQLPHWDQQDKVQFITFRLFDSLPQSKLEEYRNNTQRFLALYPKPWTKEVEKLYFNTVGRNVQYWLHQNYGSCILKHQEIRDRVVEGWLKHHKNRYYLHEFVIMPNHVHLLMSLNDTLEKCLKLIKGSSSYYIRRMVEIKGEVWKNTDFDRMVRSEESFRYYVDYIRKNPRGLPFGTLTLWSDPDRLWQKQLNHEP